MCTGPFSQSLDPNQLKYSEYAAWGTYVCVVGNAYLCNYDRGGRIDLLCERLTVGDER